MNRLQLTVAVAHLVLVASLGMAAVKTQDVEYKQGDTALKGFLAHDGAVKGKKPAVIVVHEWWGHNEHARNQALKLAEQGYVAFALDMYGKGKLATHPKDAGAFMDAIMKAPELMQARFQAALDLVRKNPEVDAGRIAAVGYCFGGSVALTMARAGADLKAVATFHAGLKPVAGEAQKGKVKPTILVQTGGADPMIPKEQVAAFQDEMKKADVKAEVKVYPAAKHSFTNPAANKSGVDGLEYDAAADKESWAELTKFLKGALGE